MTAKGMFLAITSAGFVEQSKSTWSSRVLIMLKSSLKAFFLFLSLLTLSRISWGRLFIYLLHRKHTTDSDRVHAGLYGISLCIIAEYISLKLSISLELPTALFLSLSGFCFYIEVEATCSSSSSDSDDSSLTSLLLSSDRVIES